MQPAQAAPGCAVNPNNSPADRIEQWVPITGRATWMEARYADVWTHVNTRTPFPNTCLCTENVNNGAGVSWSLSVPAGGRATASHYTTFSPRGVAGAPPATAAPPGDTAAPPAGRARSRERCGVTIGPSVCLEGPAELRRLGCLRRGDFVHRFRIKLKKRRGGLVANRLSRVRIVLFSLDGGPNGVDRRRPYYALDGQSLRPDRHVLRADVRLRVPRTGRGFRKRLSFRFSTCA